MARVKCGPMGHALALMAGLAVWGSAATAAADAPDAFWNAPWVQVRGADPALANALNNGLRLANQTYFYGDRSTKMLATVKGDSVSLKIIDQKTGKVLASRSGIPFSGTGQAATDSIRKAALSWMAGLSCGAGCAKTGGSAAAPKIARAPNDTSPTKVRRTKRTTRKVKRARTVARSGAVEETKLARAPSDTGTTKTETTKTETTRKADPVPDTTRTPTETGKPAAAATDKVVEKPAADVSDKAVEKPADTGPKPSDTATVRAHDLSRVRPDDTAATDGKATGGAADTATTEPKSGSAAVAAAPAVDKSPSVGTEDEKPDAPKVDEKAVETPLKPVETPEKTVETPEKPIETPEKPAETRAADLTKTPEAPGADDKPAGTHKRIDATAEPLPGVRLPAPPETGGKTAAAETPDATGAAGDDTKPDGKTAEDGEATDTTVAAADPSAAGKGGPRLPVRRPTDRTGDKSPVDPDKTGTFTRAAPDEKADATPPAGLNTDAEKPADTGKAPAADGKDDSAEKPADKVETKVAAVDPKDTGPTLANARWIGFTPAVYKGEDKKAGLWISGPFDKKERTGWVTDTATGATTRVKFIWREGGADGRTAILSKAAAKALGLDAGDVANVAVYLPR